MIVAKLFKYLFFTFFTCFLPTIILANKSEKDSSSKEFNINEIIMHHVKDAHEWHLWGSEHDGVSIHLPVILYDKGFKVFNSSHFYHGAEKMVKSGNYVYVSCKGGFGKDSVVSVINTATDAVVSTISVGASPSGIEIDANGKIWVLCGGEWNSGYTSLNKTGKLVRIDPSTNKIDRTFDFTSTTSKPSNLTINAAKNKLYYNYQGRVYSQDITATALSNTILINKSFYGMGVDPTNDYIYGADAGNFASPGYVFRYNNTGAKIDSMKVGIAPGAFSFR